MSTTPRSHGYALGGRIVRGLPGLAASAPPHEVIVRPDQFMAILLSPLAQLDWPNRKVVVFGEGETSRATRLRGHVAAAQGRLVAGVDGSHSAGSDASVAISLADITREPP